MTYNIKAWISSLAGLCLLGLSHVAPGADKTIWQGESGGLKILWTSEDIIATKGGKVCHNNVISKTAVMCYMSI